MKVNAIKRTTVCDEIVEQFKQLIKDKELKPGDKLPSERELAQLFDVSRTSIREAVLISVSLGLFKKTPDGVFINERIISNCFNPTYYLLLNDEDYSELYEARIMIETNTVELAAIKADDEDIKLMEEVLNEMSDELTIEEFAQLDSEFHLNIALACKNKVLYEFINTIRQALKIKIHEVIQNELEKGIEIYSIIRDMHWEIVGAIKDRNPTRANELMRKHLRTGKDTFIKTPVGVRE